MLTSRGACSLSLCLSLCLAVSLSLCLSVSLSLCLSLCLSVSRSLPRRAHQNWPVLYIHPSVFLASALPASAATLNHFTAVTLHACVQGRDPCASRVRLNYETEDSDDVMSMHRYTIRRREVDDVVSMHRYTMI